MNRLGWSVLAVFVLLGGGFWLLLSDGTPAPERTGTPAPVVAREERGPPADAVALAASGLAIPVAGVRADMLRPTFDQERDGGTRSHNAIDIMAPRGTPVVAAFGGTVERLFDSVGRGGLTAYVRSDDGRWIGYYAHLDGYAPGLAEGQRIARGRVLGTVGSTGNAAPEAPHLHFAIHRMRPGEGWSGGVPVDPYPLLAGGGAGG